MSKARTRAVNSRLRCAFSPLPQWTASWAGGVSGGSFAGRLVLEEWGQLLCRDLLPVGSGQVPLCFENRFCLAPPDHTYGLQMVGSAQPGG